jgi:hypothetical protein
VYLPAVLVAARTYYHMQHYEDMHARNKGKPVSSERHGDGDGDGATGASESTYDVHISGLIAWFLYFSD